MIKCRPTRLTRWLGWRLLAAVYLRSLCTNQLDVELYFNLLLLFLLHRTRKICWEWQTIQLHMYRRSDVAFTNCCRPSCIRVQELSCSIFPLLQPHPLIVDPLVIMHSIPLKYLLLPACLPPILQSQIMKQHIRIWNSIIHELWPPGREAPRISMLAEATRQSCTPIDIFSVDWELVIEVCKRPECLRFR